jgi:hypothetical protein
MVLGMATGVVWAEQGGVQAGPALDDQEVFHQAEQAMAFILVGDGNGHLLGESTGVVIRSDGIVLAPYHHVKGAAEVQVRLRNGEIYDQVELVGFDERRDVATLHVLADRLPTSSIAPLEGIVSGDRVRLLTADRTMAWLYSDGFLGPVRLADEIPGAGEGYRLVQFTANLPADFMDGALVNSRGQVVGILTYARNAGGRQWAVPIDTLAALTAQGLRTALGNGKNLKPMATSHNFFGAEPPNPINALASARTLRVNTKTTYFTPFMLQKELMNNAEFLTLGLSVVNGDQGGELLVEVDRPLFTYDFTYSVSDSHTGIVVATGKVTAIDGPHAAQGIAEKLVREFEKGRALQQAAQANGQEAMNAQQ